MVPNYLELIERAYTGPVLKKEDWDFEQVALTTRRLVKKYQITWTHDEIVPNDPDLADRIFQAAVELAQSIGV